MVPSRMGIAQVLELGGARSGSQGLEALQEAPGLPPDPFPVPLAAAVPDDPALPSALFAALVDRRNNMLKESTATLRQSTIVPFWSTNPIGTHPSSGCTHITRGLPRGGVCTI